MVSMVNSLHGSSQVTNRAAKPLISYDDVLVMWIRADMAMLTCLMTCKMMSILMLVSFLVRVWRMRCLLACGGGARNLSTCGGACFNGWSPDFLHMQISGHQGQQGNVCDCKAIWACVIFGENYGSSWRHMWRWSVTGFLGFAHGRLRSTSMWLVSSVESLICKDLKGEARHA